MFAVMLPIATPVVYLGCGYFYGSCKYSAQASFTAAVRIAMALCCAILTAVFGDDSPGFLQVSPSFLQVLENSRLILFL